MRSILLLALIFAGCGAEKTNTNFNWMLDGPDMALEQPSPTEDLGTSGPGDMARRRGDMATSMNPAIIMDMSQTNPGPVDMAMGMNPGPVDMAMGMNPTTPVVTLVFTPDKNRTATGLAFHPTRDELWVVNYYDDSVITVKQPGKAGQTFTRRLDPAADHFMHRPTGMAWGAGDTWATCGENNNGGNNFTGPSLFSGDPAIFAIATPDGLGSHLDMLHYSPWCMGIAHQTANIYWVFDDYHGSITKYDFKLDHGPGFDDHSDGVIRVYAQGQLLGAQGIPSHLAFNPSDNYLYIADTGHKRVVKLDTASGSEGSSLSSLEPSIPKLMNNTNVVAVVTSGLDKPSGIAIAGSSLWVGDNGTSKIYKYSLTGTLQQTVTTTLAAGSIAGLTIGPDGKVWFVDMKTSKVYRID